MTTSRRQWTDDTIREELLPVAVVLGRMPKRSELTERGIGGMWAAMGRRGGVDAWREVVAARLAQEPADAPAAPAVEVAPAVPAASVAETAPAPEPETAPSLEDVRVAAYFLFENGHPGDAAAHWHAAERELAAA